MSAEAICASLMNDQQDKTKKRDDANEAANRTPDRHCRRPDSGCHCTGHQTPAPADIVFVNGKVFTADDSDHVVQGFAIKDDRFVATGSDDDVRRLMGPQTRVIDLKGRFVSPGITDDHFHNEGGGSGVDLSHVRSLGELLTTVANAATAAPADAVIVSNSDWHEAQLKEQRLPTSEEIEQAFPASRSCWRAAATNTFSTRPR